MFCFLALGLLFASNSVADQSLYGNDDFPVGIAGGEGDLSESVPGSPGQDYPIYSEVPETSFVCEGQVDGGYYADPEAECQSFHICVNDGHNGLSKFSFLCPNGTLFDQRYFICNWWFNVDCSAAESFYSLNDEIAAEREANSAGGLGIYGEGNSNVGQNSYNGRKSGGRKSGNERGSQGSASSITNTYSRPSNGFSGREQYSSPTKSFSSSSSYDAPRSPTSNRSLNSRNRSSAVNRAPPNGYSSPRRQNNNKYSSNRKPPASLPSGNNYSAPKPFSSRPGTSKVKNRNRNAGSFKNTQKSYSAPEISSTLRTSLNSEVINSYSSPLSSIGSSLSSKTQNTYFAPSSRTRKGDKRGQNKARNRQRSSNKYKSSIRKSTTSNGNKSPANNEYKSPASDRYNIPVNNGYNSPASNGYNSPVSNGYNSPANTGYNSPANNGYNSPVSNGYNSPANNGHNSPVRNGYNSPTNNEYDTSLPMGNNLPANVGYQSPSGNGPNSPTRNRFNSPASNGYNSPVTNRYNPPKSRSPTRLSGQGSITSKVSGYIAPKVTNNGHGTPSSFRKPSRKNSQRKSFRKPAFGTKTNQQSPRSKFSSANNGYSSPNPRYESPTSGYSSPKSEFSSPVSAYSSPNGGLSSPNIGYSSPKSSTSKNNSPKKSRKKSGRRRNQGGQNIQNTFAPLDYGIVSSPRYNGPSRTGLKSSNTKMTSQSRYAEPSRGASDSYTASGVVDSYGSPQAGNSYLAPNEEDSFVSSGAGDVYGAPGDSYGSPHTDDSFIVQGFSDTYGAPGLEDTYSLPTASDTYGVPAAPISENYKTNNFGQSALDDSYEAPNRRGSGFGASRNSGFKSKVNKQKRTKPKKKGFSSSSTTSTSFGSSYTEPNGEEDYIGDNYGAPASNLLDLGYDDYEYDELPTYGRHGRDVQIESPSMTTNNYNNGKDYLN